MNQIDKGIRVTNYCIDLTAIIIGWIIISLFSQNIFLNIGLYYLLYFCYYFFLELITGQTLGKLVTKTKVVKKNGKRPGILNILIRSFLRLIPIDWFSYAFGTEHGFHDVVSFTKLTKKNPPLKS